MAVNNQQIGWNEEDKLLQYISKQLERLISVVSKTEAGFIHPLTVDNSTLQLNIGTTYDGTSARTISIKPSGAPDTLFGMNSAGTGLEFKTVNNGLISGSGVLQLGGLLIRDTNIDGHFAFNIGNTTETSQIILRAGNVGAAKGRMLINSNGFVLDGFTSTPTNRAGELAIGTNTTAGISITSYKTGTNTFSNSFGLSNNSALFTDGNSSKRGIEYAATGYVTQTHSLVDKEYTDSHFAGNVFAVNVVSPTAPDRTIKVTIGGVDLYIAAKTTNN